MPPKFPNAANWFAAIVIVVVFLVFVLFLGREAQTATDESWARLLTLFSSIEALAFAAAGLLLGRAVDRPTREAVNAQKAAIETLTQTNRQMGQTADALQNDLTEIVTVIDDPAQDTAPADAARAALGRAMTRAQSLSIPHSDPN